MTDDEFIDNCNKNPGMRLAWGYLEETETFYKNDYFNSDVYKKDVYKKYNTAANKDDRNLLEEDDIVQVNWPKGWYIPTAKDLELLNDNTTKTKVTEGATTFVKLSGKGEFAYNSILIPLTGYKDDNKVNATGDAYLQSCTIGVAGSEHNTQYALQINSSSGSLVEKAGRRTGLMIRPVKYVRVK